MRSMLQLLGGVAVAGAVAAGTTAFTATGVSGSLTVVGGGSASITVAGATLTAASLIQDVTTPANFGNITGVKVTLSATPALSDTNTKVSAQLTGTGGDAAATVAYFDCGNGTSGVWTCTIPSSKYYTGVTTVDIKVSTLP